MTTPRVVVIVVTYNSLRFVPGLLAGVRQHLLGARVELVVVDNASTDGTRQALEAEARDFTLIAETRNTGFAEGNNLGIAEARRRGAEFVFCLNPDAVATPGCLVPLLAVMDARPEVAAAQPLLVLHDEPNLVNSAGNQIHFCGFGYSGGYRGDADAVARGGVQPVTYATGAALLLRMSALAEVGGFDDSLFLYHEDLDLQLRLRQRGYDVVLVPEARVLHKYDPSFSARKYYWMERNRWLVLVKDWPLDLLLASLPALAGVELAVLAFAARGGWLGEKLRSYRDFARLLPTALAARRGVQAARQSPDSERRTWTARLEFDGHTGPLVRLANPVLAAYWYLIGGRSP